MKSTSFAIVSTLLASATAQDRYQKIGNEIGQFYSSVGNVLANPNADAASLSVAAQQADVAVASFQNEIRTMDWSDLGADAAKQQNANMELYLVGLNNANAELHAIATKAAVEQRNTNFNAAKDQQQAQPQQRPYQYNNRINAVVTGVPKMHNKAVVKDESATITTSSEPTATSSTLDSYDSKRESKSSQKEEKSESRESKKEEKSASRESKSASKAAESATTTTAGSKASNGTATTTASPTTQKHSKNNAIVATGASAGAFIAAIFAFI